MTKKEQLSDGQPAENLNIESEISQADSLFSKNNLRKLKERWEKSRQIAQEKKVHRVCASLSNEEFLIFWDKIDNKDGLGWHPCMLLDSSQLLLARQMMEMGLLNTAKIFPKGDPNQVEKLLKIEQKIKKLLSDNSMKHNTFLLVKEEYKKRFPQNN